MGMHVGLIVAQCEPSELRDHFLAVWPQFKVIASVENLPDADALWRWREQNAEFVSAADWSADNRGTEVFAFWKDGPWSIMLDASYVQASDLDGLARLSLKLGTVLSFVVESAGGCAFFWCYENGKLRRAILNDGESVELEGDPLPQEESIRVDDYYMDETEQLWKSFGLHMRDGYLASDRYLAVSVEDQTDYSNF